MLGPVDLEDWTFDRRDLLSMRLRRHPTIEDLARSGDGTGLAAEIRAAAAAFARQALLPMEALEALADALGVAD
ncbi:MAG TPA: hypothetical protein VIL72_13810 [Beijerinckiaceae bacterium]|jgi:hypothetical protein